MTCQYCRLELQPGPLHYDDGPLFEWVTLNERKFCHMRPKRWGIFRKSHVPEGVSHAPSSV